MKTRATHLGTCQICGHRQMLPGGVLAKHGYTTRWGFFSGTCPGSGYQPFETHTDRIQAARDSAALTAKSLRIQARELREETSGDRVWVHVFHPYANRIHSGYEWQHCPAREVPKLYVGKASTGETISQSWTVIEVEQTSRDRTSKRWVEYRVAGFLGKTLRETVAYANHGYANSLEQSAKGYESYVAWQDERLATWTLQPLQERRG